MFHKMTQAPLFKGFQENEIPQLLNRGNYTIKRYWKDDVIASRGEDCNQLMILFSGSLRGEMVDLSGRILKVEDIVAPRAVASGFIFGKENTFPVNIIANEQSRILFIPKSSVMDHLKSNPVFLMNFLDNISDYIQLLSQRMFFLSFKTIREKFAQYLLNISEIKGDSFILSKSQTTLAEYFGITRPSLGRAIKSLEREGIIQVKVRKVKILNRAKLQKILHPLQRE